MTLRVSTAQLYQRGIELLQRSQQDLLRTQTQLATQQKLLTAADAPSDWAAGMGIDQLLAQTQRYQSNARTALHRLNLEEAALAEADDVLASVRELLIQANGGSLSAENRGAIAQEITALRDAMLAIANRDDGQGAYLFAGTRDRALPFAWNGSGADYGGDQQVRRLAIGNARSIADGDAGSEVFMRLRSGNATTQVSAASGNTGSVHVRQSSVYDAALYDGGTYTIRFSGGGYEVRDAASTLIDSGPYAAGTMLRVRGIALVLDGTPADGDSFTLAPAAQQDVLALIDKVAQLVDAPRTTDGERGIAQTGVQQALAELDNAQTHFSTIRAGVGLRLNAAERAGSTLSAIEIEAQSALSDLRDVDIAEAAARLQQQLLALEAAQASFTRVQGLSLFDYLR